jgi:hypothetical protein
MVREVTQLPLWSTRWQRLNARGQRCKEVLGVFAPLRLCVEVFVFTMLLTNYIA